jgi:uncharacterized protein (DUF885 family)
MRILPLLLLAANILLPAAAQTTTPDPDETRRLHALFERSWDESARLFPEWATFRGDRRFDDRWSDASPAGQAEQDEWGRRGLEEARSIRRERLAAVDQVSLDMFVERGEIEATKRRFEGWRAQSVNSSFGFQNRLAGILRTMGIDSAPRAEQVLARLTAWPARLDQETVRLQRAIDLGWVPPRPVLERALQQLDGQLGPAREGPYLEPFRRLPSSIPEAEREVLAARALTAVEQGVLPAQRRLRDFIATRMLPKAPAEGAYSSYPGGAEVYAALVREQTTTTLTPQQVHAIGLEQMALLRTRMAAVQKRMGFEGSFAQFVAHLNGPQYKYPSPEAMLEGYRAIGKRLDPTMPRLFAELPRMPYGIRAMPAFMGPGAADNYSSPQPETAEPGWYNANVLAFERRPRWALPTLVAHETVPGHHLQTARSQELLGLPAFRRAGNYTAYGEGWALYAETLGEQIGLYEQPEDLFGHLQAQAFRAARLVVDTGLHALGWSRQRAIDYLVAEVGESPVFAESEVDRYLSTPAQALAYMIGKLKIDELRDRGRARLGPKFDLRRFHNAVLDQGAMPLTVLERHIDGWIAAGG